VDYSKRDDCIEVVEITQGQYIEEIKPVVIEEEIIEEEPVDTVEENTDTVEEIIE
jgi:hypothetical protein